MVGLMRVSQQRGILGCSSSKGLRQQPKVSAPAVALLCLVVGFLMGRSYRSQDPYPLDMTAFLPPPPDMLQQQQQHGLPGQADSQPISQTAEVHKAPDLSHAAGSSVSAPGSTGGSSSSSSSSSTAEQLHRHSSASSTDHPPHPDKFAADFLQQSKLLQLRPPVTPGKSGNSFYTVAPHQILSWYPRIVLFPNFLDNATVHHIIGLAQPKLQPSSLGVGSVPVEPEASKQEVRTSEGVFLDRSMDPAGVLAHIEDKIADVTFIPPSHGEDFNVLRYRNGQHYHSHMDTFDTHFLQKMDPGFGQRMATVVMYLSDVEEGGETVFKREGRYGASHAASRTHGASDDDDASITGCDRRDFKYKPRKGDAILFFSMNPDLTINPRALHGACPVLGTSEKWVMTKWLHDKPLAEWNGEERQT